MNCETDTRRQLTIQIAGAAQLFRKVYSDPDCVETLRSGADMLWSNAKRDRIAGRDTVNRCRRLDFADTGNVDDDAVRGDAQHLALEEVHARRTNKTCDEAILRIWSAPR